MFNFTNNDLVYKVRINTTTWLIDTLYLFLIVPLASLGVLSKIISFVVFNRKEFKKNSHYTYLKIYALICLFIDFHLILFISHLPYYLFDLSISEFARVFRCLMVPSYGLKLLAFVSNSMDIVLNLERASNFNINLKFFKKLSPYLVCFILCLICFLINFPSSYLLRISDAYELFSKFEFCQKTEFSQSLIGYSISITIFLIEGPLLLILVVLSSFLAHFSMKSYFSNKTESIIINESSSMTKKINNLEKRITFITILITFFSFCFHLILFNLNVCFFILNVDKSIYIFLHFVIILVLAIKSSCLVLVFFLNKQFKKGFKKLFIK